MGRRPGPIPPTVRGGPVLVRCDIRRLAAPLRATPPPAAHRDPVLGHRRTRDGRDIRRRGAVDARLCQRSPTRGTRGQCHRDVHRWRGDLLRQGGLAVVAGASAGLPPRPLRVGDARPLGKRGSLALCATPELLDLGLEGRMARGQLRSLALERDQQGQQLITTQGCEVLGWCHGAYCRPGKYGTQAANQLPILSRICWIREGRFIDTFFLLLPPNCHPTRKLTYTLDSSKTSTSSVLDTQDTLEQYGPLSPIQGDGGAVDYTSQGLTTDLQDSEHPVHHAVTCGYSS